MVGKDKNHSQVPWEPERANALRSHPEHSKLPLRLWHCSRSSPVPKITSMLRPTIQICAHLINQIRRRHLWAVHSKLILLITKGAIASDSVDPLDPVVETSIAQTEVDVKHSVTNPWHLCHTTTLIFTIASSWSLSWSLNRMKRSWTLRLWMRSVQLFWL